MPNPNAMPFTAATRTFRKLKYVMKIWDKLFGNIFGLRRFSLIRNTQLIGGRK